MKSAVYTHFLVTAETARCKKCKSVINFVQSSNLKKHLKSCDNELWRAVENEDNKLKINKNPKSTSTSETPKGNFFNVQTLSDVTLKQQEQNLARLVAVPSMSMNIVMSEEFMTFVRNYRRQYEVSLLFISFSYICLYL